MKNSCTQKSGWFLGDSMTFCTLHNSLESGPADILVGYEWCKPFRNVSAAFPKKSVPVSL